MISSAFKAAVESPLAKKSALSVAVNGGGILMDQASKTVEIFSKSSGLTKAFETAKLASKFNADLGNISILQITSIMN